MCPSEDPNPDRQKTIKRPFSISGKGLHRGEDCSINFSPSGENSGIVFIYRDKLFPALAENVTDTKRGVSLGEIILVEHVLAACAGMGIDNLKIELSASEPPALDGSALVYVQRFKAIGLVEQGADRAFCIINKPIRVGEKDAYIEVSPFNGFKVNYMLNFEVVGRQEFSYTGDFDAIASARTFGLLSELEDLKRSGLAKGASLDNALAIGPNGFVNKPRFPDEPVRHKILDILGDLALIGKPIKGEIKAKKTGHRHNVELALRIRRGFNAT